MVTRPGKHMRLEKDLETSQQLVPMVPTISVMAYPNWWGFMPAIAKGFIDRIFLPGFAIQTSFRKIFPDKLLKGKSLRLLVTMDTPRVVVLPCLPCSLNIRYFKTHRIRVCRIRSNPLLHIWIYPEINWNPNAPNGWLKLSD